MLETGQELEAHSALLEELLALFREAHLRRRRRRRWLAGLAVTALASVVAVGALTWVNQPRGQHVAVGRGADGAGQAGHAAPAAVWVDDADQLHLGIIGSGGLVSQHVVGEANAASEPLVAAGRRVYWVDPAGAYVPALGHWSQVVRALNLRTGLITLAGAGQTVFLSADRRSLLMSQTPGSLISTPVAGGRARLLNLPHGWYLPGGDGTADPLAGQGLATANGIVVQSRDDPGVGARRIAIWNPDTGAVALIGLARAVIDAYTPPGARYSLLAWLPASCPQPGTRPPGGCEVAITNTASGAVTTVRSPSAGGFANGGAFAPGGRSLAVFVNAPSLRSARLALIDPATGALRVAAAAAFPLGMDYGWTRWLPGGGRADRRHGSRRLPRQRGEARHPAAARPGRPCWWRELHGRGHLLHPQIVNPAHAAESEQPPRNDGPLLGL
jgi:hypothetical protein